MCAELNLASHTGLAVTLNNNYIIIGKQLV